jgi:hypothetical protein
LRHGRLQAGEQGEDGELNRRTDAPAQWGGSFHAVSKIIVVLIAIAVLAVTASPPESGYNAIPSL